MSLKHSFGILLLVLYSLTSPGQQLQFTNMGDKMILPAQECYNVMQDKKGYLWIGTEAGLCRYNGKNTITFDKRNGLPEGSTYAVKEDRYGALWMLTSQNRILNYVNGHLQEAPFSKVLQERLKGSLHLSYLLDFSGDSVVYINTQSQTFRINRSTGKLQQVLRPDSTSNYFFISTPEGLLSINGGQGQDRKTSIMKAARGYVKIVIQKDKQLKELRLPYTKTKIPQWRVLTCKIGESNFFSFDNYLFKVNPDLSYSYYELTDRVVSLYGDRENGLWAGTMKTGVFYYPDINHMEEYTQNLGNYSVTGTCEDHESGIWCSTLEKGVFYCRNKKVLGYANAEGLNRPADLLKSVNGRVFSSSRSNELTEIKGRKLVKHAFCPAENYPVSDIIHYGEGWIISGKNLVVRTDASFSNCTVIKTTYTRFNAGANQMAPISHNRVMGIHFGHITEIVENRALERKTPLESPGRCIAYIGNDELLYGCKEGLYRMNVNSFLDKKIKGIEANVTSILHSTRNEAWITTTGGGLYRLSGDSAINISSYLKMPTDRFFSITEDIHSNLWIGSNAGLIKLSATGENAAVSYSYKVFNTLNGLPSNEIYKVACDSSRVYLSTIEGLCSFLIADDLSNRVAPAIFLSSLKINDVRVNPTGSILQLSYSENSLRLVFDILTFKEIANPSLFYKLKGDSTLRFNEGNELALDNMAPGTYELAVYAANNSGLVSKDPVILQFEISRPFWRTGWFIALAIFVIAFVVYAIYRRAIERIQKREEEKTRINQLLAGYQLSALQAQMNPHFIFNSINSIQSFILKKNEKEAYDYLTKFSKLIRMVLNHSQETALPLQQELEMLKLYIELEQLRFDHSFEFILTIAPEVNTYELYVPGMMIQPYVENAIWHGLMHLDKKRDSRLKLDIAIFEKLLKIMITDNGIGRKMAQAFKKESSYPSVGMKLTEQRLMMINRLQEFEAARVVVHDLYDANGEACGTSVEILIPIQEGPYGK